MNTARIEVHVRYTEDHDRFLDKVTMYWDGDSDFIKVSGDLLEDNIFEPIERSKTWIGMKTTYGPFRLKLMSINQDEDLFLFKLDGEIVKRAVYLGSVENEWSWEITRRDS